jgi:predicted transport protein
MSDLKLFSLQAGTAKQLPASSMALEKSLQVLIEKNLETFLGVRFLATEHGTGAKHAGRIDTLGLDENGCPVIIEYKKTTNANVINQGLFYLDWLLDHKADFKLLVLELLGKDPADSIDWSAPRLICIAGDFTRYDLHAVGQMQRNIELIRYCRYGTDLLLFDLVNRVTAPDLDEDNGELKKTKSYGKTAGESLAAAAPALQDLYVRTKEMLLALGDDVQFQEKKLYFAFRRIKNFACIEVQPKNGYVIVYAKSTDPKADEIPGFIRDVTDIGHWGTGTLEIVLRSGSDLERARGLLERSYEAN